MKDGVRTGELTELVAGTRIPFGGSRWVEIDADTASRFRPGDRMIVIQEDGSLVHVPRSVAVTVDETVSRARTAFEAMGFIEQDRVTHFFDRFA
ncbi:MAG: glutamate-5-semialdehyde dehydrogenase, partial [Ilumatobacteraceae bacterium]